MSATVGGDGRITAINLIGDPDVLPDLEIELDDPSQLASDR